jgi:TfoX N-terminal domain
VTRCITASDSLLGKVNTIAASVLNSAPLPSNLARMAYDEALAERVRAEVAAEEGLTEKTMFGSLAFLLDGNLAVCVRGDELLVRVGPDGLDAALARGHARLFEMGGRPMKGWVMVAPPGVETAEGLRDWVARGVVFARSLPPKAA